MFYVEQKTAARAAQQKANMYDTTQDQTAAIAKLERQGWRFANWIGSHHPDGDNGKIYGCAVMVKRGRGRTEYREVAPDGTVN